MLSAYKSYYLIPHAFPTHSNTSQQQADSKHIRKSPTIITPTPKTRNNSPIFLSHPSHPTYPLTYLSPFHIFHFFRCRRPHNIRTAPIRPYSSKPPCSRHPLPYAPCPTPCRCYPGPGSPTGQFLNMTRSLVHPSMTAL